MLKYGSLLIMWGEFIYVPLYVTAHSVSDFRGMKHAYEGLDEIQKSMQR